MSSPSSSSPLSAAVIWLSAHTQKIQINLVSVRCDFIERYFIIKCREIVFTAFYSHEIQMHTKVENRFTDPFLQWFKSSIGIVCCLCLQNLLLSNNFFYPSSTLNMDKMYPKTIHRHSRFIWMNGLCCLAHNLFEIMCFPVNVQCRRIGWMRGEIWTFQIMRQIIPLKNISNMSESVRIVIIEFYLLNLNRIFRFVDIRLVLFSSIYSIQRSSDNNSFDFESRKYLFTSTHIYQKHLINFASDFEIWFPLHV